MCTVTFYCTCTCTSEYSYIYVKYAYTCNTLSCVTFAAPVQRKKTALVTSSAKASDSEHNTSQLLDAEEAAKYDLAVSGRDVFSSSQLVSAHL